jgi:hypothetical protein
VKRPLLSLLSVQALIAVTVGLRGKAIATDVPTRSFVVACAASAIRMNGSSLVSSTTMP